MKKNKKDYNLRLLEERKRSKYLNDWNFLNFENENNFENFEIKTRYNTNDIILMIMLFLLLK
jgi:hypothetical protein